MKINRKWFAVVACVVGAGCLFSILGSAFIIQSKTKGRLFVDIASVPRRRVGLLLGCSRFLADGRFNLFFKNRIEAAASLYFAGKVEYLLVSGDNHSKGYNEARDIRDSLIRIGVPSDKIYCDYAGLRTLDSVVRAKEVFGQTEITIISQKFHNQRAIFIASRYGINAIGYNAKEVGAIDSFNTVLREQFARVKTVLDLYLLGTMPKYLGPRIAIGEQREASQE